jgi:transketolase
MITSVRRQSGGLGTAVAECLAEKAAAPCRFARIGIHDQFGETGSAAQLIHKYQLDGEGIFAQVKAFVK